MKKGGACPVSCVKEKDVRERPNSFLVHLVLFSVQVGVSAVVCCRTCKYVWENTDLVKVPR